MNITELNIIGELVAEDYRSASVFKSYGIDFCCKGNTSIKDACESKSIGTEDVLKHLEQVLKQTTAEAIDYQSWPIDLLADYIEKKHHRFVRAKTQEIVPYLQKVVRVHGGRNPELATIQNLFMQSIGELASHMKKEEMVLFPYIRKMMQAKDSGQKLPAPLFGTVQNPIGMMHEDHDAEGERFRKIAALSNNYTPPESACNTYGVAFALLKEFEEDLHTHIHLENNILFPKAIKLEKELI